MSVSHTQTLFACIYLSYLGKSNLWNMEVELQLPGAERKEETEEALLNGNGVSVLQDERDLAIGGTTCLCLTLWNCTPINA